MTSVNLTLPQWDDLSTKEFSLATFSLIYGYLKLRGLPFFLDENGAIDAQQTTGTLIVARKPPNPGALAVDATVAVREHWKRAQEAWQKCSELHANVHEAIVAAAGPLFRSLEQPPYGLANRSLNELLAHLNEREGSEYHSPTPTFNL